MIQTGVQWRKTADGRPVYAGTLRAVFTPDDDRATQEAHDAEREAHEDSPKPEVSLGLD